MITSRPHIERQRPLAAGWRGQFLSRRAGFTLVEMLVATGLVVLIMSLFAQIYGSAIGTITEQRGMANNDQKARTLSSIIRGDLQNMTYRQPAFPYGNVQGIVPMAAGDEPIIDPVNQRGYFYFSENDPGTDWDDVLQFTTMIRTGQRGNAPTHNQQHTYTGKSTTIAGAGNNQPDMDDGIADNKGQSRAAEISYFLRNGNLYRRVLLLRDPLPTASLGSFQPTTAAGDRTFNSSSPNFSQYENNTDGTRDEVSYNEKFDYAATRVSDSSGGNTLWFHSTNSLQNNLGLTNIPIAVTNRRFGFRPTGGVPVEFDSSGSFMGRFTMEETSFAQRSLNTTMIPNTWVLDANSFSWPGSNSSTNPYLRTDLDDNTTTGIIGVVDQYEVQDPNPAGTKQSATRTAEDLLLANVEGFDVKVLDPLAGNFVDIGGSAPNAAVTYLSSQNSSYQSVGGTTFIYDTWHPSMTIGTAPFPPPFRPVSLTPNNTWAGLSGTASSGAIIYVPSLIYDTTTPLASNSFVYRVISPTTGSGSTGTKQPEFPPVPGTIVQDGGVTWQCVDNRIGLKAIQITIRYRDVTSNLSRQVTLVHSFVE